MNEFINDEINDLISVLSRDNKILEEKLETIKDPNLDNLVIHQQLEELRKSKHDLMLIKEKLQQKLSSGKEEVNEMITKKNTYKKEYPPIQLEINMLKEIISDTNNIMKFDLVVVDVKKNLFTVKLVFLNKKDFIKIIMDVESEMIIECNLDHLKNCNVKNEILGYLENNKSCKVFFAKLYECLIIKSF